jgi:hypothetical protein
MRIYFHSAILAKHIRHFKAQIYAEAESNANELVQFALLQSQRASATRDKIITKV